MTPERLAEIREIRLLAIKGSVLEEVAGDLLAAYDELAAEKHFAYFGKLVFESMEAVIASGVHGEQSQDEAVNGYIRAWTKLKKERDELLAERRWIPVSERLPEKNVKVLGFHKNNACIVEWDGLRWWLRKPTHWQPLPPLPEFQ